MSKKVNNNLTSLDQLLDKKYGKTGKAKRETWEKSFENFKIGVLMEEARLKKGLTQEELADKCGTKKSYISRIENDGSDIRLSTLLKIIHEGLGAELKIVFWSKGKGFRG